jgi:hypothetical protein
MSKYTPGIHQELQESIADNQKKWQESMVENKEQW